MEVISSRHAENAKRPGKPPPPDVQGYFHRHEGRLDLWTSRAARWHVEPSSDEALSVVSHFFEPTLPLRIAPHGPSRTVSRGWGAIPPNSRMRHLEQVGGRGTRRNLLWR